MTTRYFRESFRFHHLDRYGHGHVATALLRRAHVAIDLAGTWIARRRRRATLGEIAALGDHIMLDLGFDPDEVRLEAAKPFWRA